MKNLAGKTCVITGAASGIGRQFALQLSQEGMRLALADIDMEGLEKVKKQIEADGGEVHIFKCDVTKVEDFKELKKGALAALGEIDMLINNAGVGGAGLVEELEPKDWEFCINVNLWSMINSTHVFLPYFTERAEGHIVNVGSGAGIVGIPYHIQYVVSKFSVVGFTEALYSEMSTSFPKLKVSLVCPFFLKTNIIDRSPIKIPTRLVPDGAHDELAGRMDEFKAIFWDKYTAGALPVEKAVAKYIKGIKKEKLYIFDNVQVALAQFLKGLPGPIYRMVLKSEDKRHIKLIKDSIKEMGIKG